MNLRGFLNAVYVIFVEASMAAGSVGKDLFSALDEMKELAKPTTANGNAAPASAPAPKNEAAQNDASLAQMMGMLKGSDFKGTA